MWIFSYFCEFCRELAFFGLRKCAKITDFAINAAFLRFDIWIDILATVHIKSKQKHSLRNLAYFSYFSYFLTYDINWVLQTCSKRYFAYILKTSWSFVLQLNILVKFHQKVIQLFSKLTFSTFCKYSGKMYPRNQRSSFAIHSDLSFLKHQFINYNCVNWGGKARVTFSNPTWTIAWSFSLVLRSTFLGKKIANSGPRVSCFSFGSLRMQFLIFVLRFLGPTNSLFPKFLYRENFLHHFFFIFVLKRNILTVFLLQWTFCVTFDEITLQYLFLSFKIRYAFTSFIAVH